MSDKKLLLSINLDDRQADASALINTLALFDNLNIRGTFFITINWAQQYPAFMRRLAARHEIGLYAHAEGNIDYVQLKGQKETLERLSGTLVYGFRNAGTELADTVAVKNAGFIYQAPAAPDARRTLFLEKDLWMIPLSVSPLFHYALTTHNIRVMPAFITQHLSNRILKKDGMMTVSYPLKANKRSVSFLQSLQHKGQFCSNMDWLQDQLHDGN